MTESNSLTIDYTWKVIGCPNPNKAWVVDWHNKKKLSPLISHAAAERICIAHNMAVKYLQHSNEKWVIMIAALYVRKNGCYFNVPGIDPWDESRDARKYAGPYPVIAHPPCQRWGKMYFGQPLAISKGAPKKNKGDDGGCFKAALDAVRLYGGILEHPESSHAWERFGINRPPRSGGWISAGAIGGFTCCVEQGRYGHYARKPTWLYAYNVILPELLWGESQIRLDPVVVERMGIKRAKRLGEVGAKGGGKDSPARIGTPLLFRDLLISIVAGEK